MEKPKMIYTQTINASMLPLHFYIKSPGVVELLHSEQGHVIDRFGTYYFSLEKNIVIRKPKPYSKPPCIELGSKEERERNMFIGNYTNQKCRDTCLTKSFLFYCKTIFNVHRVLVRNQERLLQQAVELTYSDVEKCTDANSSEMILYYDRCVGACRSSCFEEFYDVKVREYIYSQRKGNSITLLEYKRVPVANEKLLSSA